MGKKQLRNAVDTFMVANDPRFLFNRLRKDSYVSNLADRMQPAALVRWVNCNSKKDPGSIEHLVDIYAHLTALALHDDKSVLSAIKRLRPPNAQWGTEMVKYVRESLTPTQYRSVIGQELRRVTTPRNSVSTFTRTITPPKPTG
jgi:hypothetical protein